MKGSGGVAEPERHYIVDVTAEVIYKRGLSFVASIDLDLMKSH